MNVHICPVPGNWDISPNSQSISPEPRAISSSPSKHRVGAGGGGADRETQSLAGLWHEVRHWEEKMGM